MKRENAQRHIKSMEAAEFEQVTKQISDIENKYKKSQDLHDKLIEQRISEMKSKNQVSMAKLQGFKQKQEEELKHKYMSFFQKELKDSERQKKLNSSMKKSINKQKLSLMSKSMKNMDNRKMVMTYVKHRIENIVDKLNSKDKKIEEHKEQKLKETKIKQELQKLKREDIEVELNRKKRLDQQYKSNLIEKDSQLSLDLLKSKQKTSYIERVKLDEAKRSIQEKSTALESFMKAQIWSPPK